MRDPAFLTMKGGARHTRRTDRPDCDLPAKALQDKPIRYTALLEK